MALESGTKLGSYEISDLLGKGGMGEVYRARDTKLGREVAIKVLPSEFAQDAERLARLEREARMLAALNHPNIAAIHGLEESDDTRFLVLELVEGDTLADRLKSGAVPVEESLKLALQIAEALEDAHERGVIHRDLKPANIKITPEGRVKVLDFGLAKAFIGEQADVNLSNSPTLSMQATQQGVILGTAAYMSPEQARGETADRRADVWAFGCTLFEMLTGAQAFDGKTVSDVLAGVLRAEPNWQALPTSLHPRIRLLLDRCLEKDPRDRYRDIADARVDIQHALRTRPDRAPEPAVSKARPDGASRSIWIAAAAAVVAGVLVWILKPEPAREAGLVTRFDHVLSEDQLFRNSGRDVLAVSPDGTTVVYNTADGLFLRTLDSREARLIPGTEPALAHPFFSPDGEWVGYYDLTTGQLRKIRTGGGSSVTLATISVLQGATWGVDDTILFGQPEGIMAVSGDGGEPQTIVETVGAEDLWDPQRLPDGSILFTSFTGGGGLISVQPPGSATRAELFPGERAVYVPTGHLVTTDPAGTAGSLLARSFDIDTYSAGGPVPVEEGVWLTTRTQFAVSPTGTLAFAEGTAAVAGDVVLAFANRAGDTEILAGLEPAQYRGPRVSPDGTRLAVEIIDDNRRSSIWIHDLTGGRAVFRLPGQTGNNMRPIWTPDSQMVTFASDREGPWGVYSQAVDGISVPQPLLMAEEGVQYWPDSWSPDRSALSFTRIVGSLESFNGQSVWTVTVDEEGGAGEPEPLSQSEAGGSAFSPDGGWIAYRNNAGQRGPANQIHAQPFPPSGQFIPVTENGGSYPVWSESTGELIYRRGAPAGGTTVNVLASVPITTDGGLSWGEEELLPIPGFQSFFGFRDFDVLPNGEGLVVVVSDDVGDSPAETARSSIQVVVNWSQLLEERVPVP